MLIHLEDAEKSLLEKWTTKTLEELIVVIDLLRIVRDDDLIKDNGEVIKFIIEQESKKARIKGGVVDVLGKIIIFSGYAGSGKNTIINRLKELYKGVEYIPSVTTRGMRTDEKQGEPYYFWDADKFNREKEKGRFIETENVHGNWYGTLQELYDDNMKKENLIIKDIDVNGAMKFKSIYGDAVIQAFIRPTDDRVVVDRMKIRGDSLADIENRKKRIEYEKKFEKFFDATIINDDLEDAIEKARELIECEGVLGDRSKVYLTNN